MTLRKRSNGKLTMSDYINAMTHALAQFAPEQLTITDDSGKHVGHAGARPQGNSHFTVAITSAQFKGMSRVARHRAVYAALEPFFKEGLHALAVDAKAPGE